MEAILMDTLKRAMEIVDVAPVAILTTINTAGYPESRAMLNLRNEKLFGDLAVKIHALDDGTTLIFTTNTSSSKMKQLTADTRVSLYYCIAESFKGAWISGDMQILDSPEDKEFFWQNGWEMYYPLGRSDPDYTVLKLVPQRLRVYGNLAVNEWKRA